MSNENKTSHTEFRKLTEKAELSARYWKAQYELKYYTLQDSKIGAEYFDLVAKMQAERTPEAPAKETKPEEVAVEQ